MGYNEAKYLQKIRKKPWRVFMTNDEVKSVGNANGGIPYDKLPDAGLKSVVDRAGDSFDSIAKSLITNETPFYYNRLSEKKFFTGDDRLDLSFGAILDLIEKSSIKGTKSDSSNYFDLTRAFATYYSLLWQTAYKRGYSGDNNANVLDIALDIFNGGREFFKDSQQVKNVFGEKWVITQRVAEEGGERNTLYTGVILPVKRANDDEAKRKHDRGVQDARYLGAVNEDVIKSPGKYDDKRYAQISGWRVNRAPGERRAYDGECLTPLWLNYQMACTNPRKTNFGHPDYNVIVKDDFFKYDESLVIKPELEKLPSPNYKIRSFTSTFKKDTIYNRIAVAGDDAVETYPRAAGSLTRNVKHWQLFNHPLAWWNIVQPWKIEDVPNDAQRIEINKFLGWGEYKQFNKANGDWDHVEDGNRADLGYSPYAWPNRTIALQHGSIYGLKYNDAGVPVRDPDQEGLLDGGLLGDRDPLKPDLLTAVNDVYGWEKKAEALPLDLVFTFLKGETSTNSSTLEHLKHNGSAQSTEQMSEYTEGLIKTGLVRTYFGFDRTPSDPKSNFGGLAFALEPLKFVALYEENEVKASTLEPTYVTAFYFFSWVLSIFNKAWSEEDGGALRSYLSRDNFPGYHRIANGSDVYQHLSNNTFQEQQQYIYQFLLNFIFALLKEAKDQYDKIGASDLGDPKLEVGLIGSGDDFNEAAKGQIIENAQCYMLNTIKTWADAHTDFSAGYNLEYQSILITRGRGSTGPGNPRYMGTKCDHFLNLIGKKDDVLAKLLNIRPADLALLQPRIRLYQQRRRINPKTGKEELKTQKVDIPGPFETNVKTGTINKILQAQKGRMFGAGIKEINITSEGGNKAMSVNSHITTEIKFYFNRIEDIFVNYPKYKVDNKGKIDFTNVKYPFGISPGFTTDNAPASIAELVFPPMLNKDDLEYGKFADVQLQDFQIMLEYGWNIPQNFFKGGMTGEQKKVVDKLREKTLFKTFFLQPLDSEFKMNQNGSIELNVEYVAYPHSLMQARKNKLFPSLFFSTFPNERKFQEEFEKLRKKIKEAEENKGVKSQKNLSKVKNLKKEFKKKVADANDKKLANFLSRNIRQLFGYLMGLEKGDITGIETQEAPKYRTKPVFHRVLLPKAALGIYDEVKKVRRWQPYRELSELSKLKMARRNVPFKTGRRLTKDGPQSTGNTFNDAAMIVGNAVRLEQQVKSSLKSKDKDTAIQYKKTQNAFYKQLNTDAFIVSDETSVVPIDFLYFGDLVEIVIEFVENDLRESVPAGEAIREIKRYYADKVNFVFGCLTLPNVKSGGATENVYVKVTDLPIVSNILVDFIVNYIVKPEKYNISYIEFIVEFYRWFLRNYLSTKCFKGIREIASMHPEIQFFSMYARPKLKGKNRHALVKPGSTKLKGIAYSKAEFAKRIDNYDKQQLANKNNEEPTHFCYLAGQTIGDGSYDYDKDLAQNIHHFYIGQDTGLVRSIEFTAIELEGRKEAAYSIIGDSLNKAVFMIPRIYDVTVTMVGNHLFEPGQTFFVNPTLGTSLTINKKKLQESDILTNTGLGGYYYINKIESRMKAGLYETVIEGIKTGLSSEPVETTVESISAEDLQASTLEEIKEQQEKMKEASAGGDILEQIENFQIKIGSIID